jgi:hypothetical protein
MKSKKAKKDKKVTKKVYKKTKKASLTSHLTGRSIEDIKRDRKIKAKTPGKRKSAKGKTYTETRPNRSDINPKHKF